MVAHPIQMWAWCSALPCHQQSQTWDLSAAGACEKCCLAPGCGVKLPQVLASGSWMPSDVASSCFAVLRNSSSLLAEAISDV